MSEIVTSVLFLLLTFAGILFMISKAVQHLLFKRKPGFKDKVTELRSLQDRLDAKNGIKTKPFSTFSFFEGGYNYTTKKISLSHQDIHKNPLEISKFQLARYYRVLLNAQGKTTVDLYKLSLTGKGEILLIVLYSVWGSFCLEYLKYLEVKPTEALETIQSMLFFPINLIILRSVYRNLWSSSYKENRKASESDADVFAHKETKVGPKYVKYLEDNGKQKSRFYPSYKDRLTTFKN